jgi:hypothetical protein
MIATNIRNVATSGLTKRLLILKFLLILIFIYKNQALNKEPG